MAGLVLRGTNVRVAPPWSASGERSAVAPSAVLRSVVEVSPQLADGSRTMCPPPEVAVVPPVTAAQPRVPTADVSNEARDVRVLVAMVQPPLPATAVTCVRETAEPCSRYGC